jgi:peptide/nickel transport system substrate-binding protein
MMSNEKDNPARRDFLTYSARGATAAGLGVVGASSPVWAAPKRGGILQVATGDASHDELLDPSRAHAGNDAFVCGQIYQRLTRYNIDSVVSPELATRWDISPDLTKWTFHLRPNVFFHDGSPLSANDVAHTMRRILDKSHGSPLFGELSRTLAPEGIQVVDPLTIRFSLNFPNALFDLTVGDKRAGIVKAGTDQITIANAYGTGPFKIVSFVPGESWEVKRNERYWEKGLPYLDGVRLINIPDVAARGISLRSGSTHVSSVTDFGDAKEISANNALEILEAKDTGFAYIVMDSTVAPFNDPRVAEAVKLAVDREKLLSLALHGYGTLTTDIPLPSTSQFFPSGLGIKKQDIRRSKELLAAAGFPNGLDFELFTTQGTFGMMDVATAFAALVAPAGIRAKINDWNPKTFWSEVWLKKPAYCSFYNTRHPSSTLNILYTTNAAWKETKFSNARVDGIAKDGVATADPAKRRALEQEAMRLVAQGASNSIAASLSRLLAQRRGVIAGLQADQQEYLFAKKAYFV